MHSSYSINRKFNGIHQLFIVLFMFSWIKTAFNLEQNAANAATIAATVQLNNQISNRSLSSPFTNSSSALELALKNAKQLQPAELQLIKIKRFYDKKNQRSIKNNSLLDSFKINANTIVRTQDSRADGASYLNETELPSNDECLKWCLQNKKCNLAVYEEKNQGSCYLFDCGTITDFKCKFTKHNFYTSSILTIDRESLRKNDFQQQHENDLVNLRTNVPINLILSNSDNKSHTGMPIINQTQSKEENKSSTNCQQFQFACKNGLDCIAIYNVCDGIKQCADGSDEAAELHCPDSSNQIAQILSINSKPTTSEASTMGKDGKKTQNPFQGLVTPDFNYKKLPEVIKLDKAPNTNNLMINNAKNIPNTNVIKPWPSVLSFDPINGYPVTNWNDYTNYLGTLNSQNAMNRNALSSNVKNQNANQNNPTNSKDFNSLIWQMMDPNQQQQQKTFFNALTNNIQQQQFLQNLFNKQQFNNWLDSSNKNSAALGYLNYINSKQEEKQPISNNPTADESMKATNEQNNNPINRLDEISTQKQTIKTTTVSSVTSSVQASNLNRDRYVSYDFKQPSIKYSGKDDYYADDNEQDTNSAVIALILGLFITIMLIVIVGFRMGSIKKKIQRRGGRTTLAHDADYLVNGMYL